MFVSTVRVRQCSDAFFIAEAGVATLESICSNLLHKHKLLLMCGLPCSGKSFFIENYTPKPNHTFTRWNRETIMTMIYNDGKRIERMNKHIENLESEILTEMMKQSFHQVLVDGWYLIPYHRKKILSYNTENSSACLVFDADIDDIINRAKKTGKLRIPEEEIEMFIKRKKESAIWPNFSEGWSEIIYFCTFNTDESLKYMKQSLIQVKK